MIPSEPSPTTVVPDHLPFEIVFQADDADGAMGGVVHEVVKLDGCTIYDGNTYGNGDGLLSDEHLPLSYTELTRARRVPFDGVQEFPWAKVKNRFDFAREGVLHHGGTVIITPGMGAAVIIPTEQGQLIERL